MFSGTFYKTEIQKKNPFLHCYCCESFDAIAISTLQNSLPHCSLPCPKHVLWCGRWKRNTPACLLFYLCKSNDFYADLNGMAVKELLLALK